MSGEREHFLMPGEGIALLLLVALVIGFFLPSMSCPPPARKERRLHMKLRSVTMASSAYRKDLGEFPPVKDATGLARTLSWETERDGRVYGPYMEFREKTPEKASLDPWGTPLLYERSPDGQSFRLGSAGPDRKFGTEDDIFVESPKPKSRSEAGSEH